MRALALAIVVLAACEPSVVIGEADAGANAGADAGTMAPADAGDAGVQVVAGCPRVKLGRSTEVTFSSDTSSLPNLVQSNRLEWREAPDDALEFIAASAGNYVIELTSPNLALGASAQEYRPTGPQAPFTSAACPPAGEVVSIDGVYDHNQPAYPIALKQDQRLLLFISAPYWAAVKTGAYTLVVKRVP